MREFEADPDPQAYEHPGRSLAGLAPLWRARGSALVGIAHYADTHGFERDQDS